MIPLAEPLRPSHDLLAQQADMEMEMTSLGIERLRASIKRAVEMGREDTTTYGEKLLDSLIGVVAGGIKDFMDKRKAGKGGPKGAAYKHLKKYGDDFDTVAFIALRIFLSGITGKPTQVPVVAGRIGRAVEDEYRYRLVRESDRKFYDNLRDVADRRSSYKVKRKVVNLFIARREVELPENWPETDVMLLGQLLVETIIMTTGLAEKVTHFEGPRNTRLYLSPTPETRKFIEDRVAAAAVMSPLYEPMIVPPVDWTGSYKGGYLTRHVRPLRMVKSFSKRYSELTAGRDMTLVKQALNATQATAWAINPFILTVLEMAWEAGHGMGGIPTSTPAELPPKPFDIDTNEEARARWRKEAHPVIVKNNADLSKRAAFTTALNTARKYSLFPAIYFPHQLDFRGRLYAAPQLNHQGQDWMKAVLQFSKGLPLDEESAPFLAIHIANTWGQGGVDKAELSERVQWVYDNEERILDCATNPFNNRWWTEADKPYCFLAACRDWLGWKTEGEGYLSAIPIALDGSCSGIQHFSMATLDEVGGRAVNLIPSATPADIYTDVLEKAINAVRHDASSGGASADVAAQWLRSLLMARSMVKRPTMTYGYGSNQFGFRDQIYTDTLKLAYALYKEGKGPWYFEEDGFAAAVYMAGVIMRAVEGTVVRAAQAMRWLRDIARVVVKGGTPVQWSTPDGFFVVQNYRMFKETMLDTLIYGSRLTMSVSQETMELDLRRQVSGFSPNYIHSLDANHMRLTVRRAAENGITDFALIHDSFGTHAANTARFFVLVRETLVEMYTEQDVLGSLHQQLSSHPGCEGLLPPPSKGTLDIKGVLECDFAFA